VSESFKENDKLEVINLLGNDFTDRSIRFLGEALAENKKSKLSILKIGNFVCDAEVFQTFLKQGFEKSPVLKYIYITTSQYMHPYIKKLQEIEGENPKTLVVTEAYDSKLDTPMLIELMS
jgi:Ran GTPase-activating protein (RanGAP) involved in mRNA processing and transport